MKSLAEAVRAGILDHSETRKLGPLRRGLTILDPGQPRERIYLVSAGLVKVPVQCHAGREVILALAGPGEFFGLCETLSSRPANFTATVLYDAEVYEIPGILFSELFASNNSSWLWLAELGAQTMKFFERRLEIFHWPDAEQRLLALFPLLAERCKHLSDGDGHILIPLRQEDIATLIGATRETTSSLLNVLARRGTLKLGRGRLLLPAAPAAHAKYA